MRLRWQIALMILGLLGSPVAAVAKDMTPDQVVAAYLIAAHEHRTRADLSIYSAATVAMMRNWPLPTPTQELNEVRSYAACRVDRTQIKGVYAVVRYRVTDRGCAPFFLVREEGAWRLDLMVMRDLIRFDTTNRWHLVRGARSPYAFAFQDWQFDRDGYVVGARSSGE